MLLREFKDAGFAVWDTGGCCTAYGLNLGAHAYILVTDGDWGKAPDSETTDFMVGIYATEPATAFAEFEGGNLFDGDCMEIVGVGAALAAVAQLQETHKDALASMAREAA